MRVSEVFEGSWLVKKGRCILIGNRFVIPHDTIPSNVTSNDKKTMQENLTEIIKQYLKIETNYAVIINGNYGIGKTYFFKDSLFPEISNISLPNNEDKKYTPIHISLFGIKSIEDLQTQIFFGIYPILKKRSLKLAAGIGKSLIRGIANLNGLGDINDYFADLDLNAKDWINYDELVLCLDDIDRKSDSLNIKDTLGFINTLVY